MDERQLETLGRKMEGYELEKLVSMVAHQRHEYLPAVIQLAEDELRRRGYSEAVIEELQSWEETRAAEHERHLEEEIAAIGSLDQAQAHCHLCGAPEPSVTIPFGLSAVVGEEEDPQTVLKAGFVSALTVPLLGLAFMASGKRVVSETIPLRLRLCTDCSGRKRWLGTWDLSEEDYRRHPGWARAEAIGFANFVSGP